MVFRDSRLRAHWEKVIAKAAGCPPEQQSVVGLLDAWYWFHATEGPDSPRVAEAVELLLSADLRPGLRQFYQQGAETMNENAIRFRDRLGEIAGENFG